MGSCLDFSGLWCLMGRERQSALPPVHQGIWAWASGHGPPRALTGTTACMASGLVGGVSVGVKEERVVRKTGSL